MKIEDMKIIRKQSTRMRQPYSLSPSTVVYTLGRKVSSPLPRYLACLLIIIIIIIIIIFITSLQWAFCKPNMIVGYLSFTMVRSRAGLVITSQHPPYFELEAIYSGIFGYGWDLTSHPGGRIPDTVPIHCWVDRWHGWEVTAQLSILHPGIKPSTSQLWGKYANHCTAELHVHPWTCMVKWLLLLYLLLLIM